MCPTFNMFIDIVAFIFVLSSTVSGQGLDLGLDLGTLRTVGDAYQATQAELLKSQGVFIRTAYNDGCLTAGCCGLGFAQVHYSENCPLWTWYRWSFQGPILVAHKPLMSMCLDCRYGRADCVVGTTHCTGSHSQKWTFGLHLNRTTVHGDLLFSIHNHLFPTQCVTIDTEAWKGLVLRDCVDPPIVEQLFYVDRDWFQTAASAHELLDVRQSHFGNSSRHSTFTY